MRLVQFEMAQGGRRAGVVEEETVYDLASLNPRWNRVYFIFREAQRAGMTLEAFITSQPYRADAVRRPYAELLACRSGEGQAWLLPPLDHPDPAHCLVGGTGLTHLGSTAQRDQMHKSASSSAPKTDSQKMFDMGLAGGKPAPGKRGIEPECFYKGSGAILRGPNDWLDIPPFSQDGGEEPEIVACYVIGEDGTPYRLGFAMANEWSDHTQERVNYLWLAPSKLRTCAIGPELVTDEPFQDLRGHCRISRQGAPVYDAGELLTGEANMCHSLANMEDHHFKYPQFRLPGDVHIYFFGTMKLSFGQRGSFEQGDRIEIAFGGMGAPLVNFVRRCPPDETPVLVRKG